MAVEERETGAPAAERALDILEFLEAREEPQSLAEIVAGLGVPKASAHRLIGTLKMRGYVRQAGPRGGYTLGLRVLGLASRAAERLDIVQIAREPMQRLAAATGEACQVSVLSGRSALCVARVSSPAHPDVALIGRPGSAFPLHAVAVGKALLAFATEAVREEYLAGELTAYTPFTHHTGEALRVELDDVRRDGLARDIQEYKLGLCAMAVPLFDHDGAVNAALALPYLYGAEPADQVTHLIRTGREISQALGAR